MAPSAQHEDIVAGISTASRAFYDVVRLETRRGNHSTTELAALNIPEQASDQPPVLRDGETGPPDVLLPARAPPGDGAASYHGGPS
jgi:hypothetical protein